MKTNRFSPIIIIGLILTLGLAACGGPATTLAPASATSGGAAGVTQPAQATAEPLTAALSELVNSVEVKAAAQVGFAPAVDGDTVEVGDQVRTGAQSSAKITLSDGTIVRVGADASFVLQEMVPSDENFVTRLKLEVGELWVSLVGGAMEVETPVGVAAVRGSYAGFAFDPVTGTLYIKCLEGSCDATNENGEIQLGNFQGTTLTEAGPGPVLILTGQDLEDFMNANPDVANAIVATLTAAPPATATPVLTDTIAPTRTTGNFVLLFVGLRGQNQIFITFDVPLPVLGSFHGETEGRNYDCSLVPDIPGRLFCTGPLLIPGQRVQFSLFLDGFDSPMWVGEITMPVSDTPYAGSALENSPLYRALSQQQKQTPIGPISGLVTMAEVVMAGWAYRRRGRS